jgi:hypothetical protein
MAYFTKRDDCIWFKHLSPELQLVLSRLGESEPVSLKLDGRETVWSRMRNGPLGPTLGIRIMRGADIWRAVPRGAEFSLELAPSSGAAVIGIDLTPEPVSLTPLAPASSNNGCLFGEYFFADYSGAASIHGQRKSIKVASWKRHSPTSLESGFFTRDSLVEWMHWKLLSAWRMGVRVCFGQDHSYGFPLGFARELGIAGLPWRSAVGSFLDGCYAADAPRFSSVPEFAAGINEWLRSRGMSDYFWSATKKSYKLPSAIRECERMRRFRVLRT